MTKEELESSDPNMIDFPPMLAVIDDDRNLLFSLKKFFQNSGFRVVTAHNGSEGLSIVKTLQPDLVICDVSMPAPDGFEVQRLLRKDPLTQAIPFIFLTGQSSKSNELIGIENGADDYISKPFDADLLLARVRASLRRTKLNQAIGAKNFEIGATENAVESLSAALDLRDHETGGHSVRVTDLTVRLAKRISISEPELNLIRRGALLHDVGKIGISDNILLKQGRLSQEERQIIEQHPIFAYELLSKNEFLKSALDIPLYHHERWDGSGYPYGIRGNTIPLAARIFALADVWDAITNDRSYQKAIPVDQAREVILSGSGSLFDPDLVPLFLALVEESDDKK